MTAESCLHARHRRHGSFRSDGGLRPYAYAARDDSLVQMSLADSSPTLHLRAADYPGANPITGTITLEIGDENVPALLTASLTEAPYVAQLPIFQAITDELTARGIAREAAAGRSISCKPGCGACCRQPVPLAAVEARGIAALVAAMPDAQRDAVTGRFAAARTALDAAGITTQAAEIAAMDRATRDAYGRRYFRLGLACPFLEAENCTIHPDRPLSCREYLVTSPASACDDPTDASIRTVPLAGRPSAAVTGRGKELEGHGTVMLVDALAWVAVHPAPEPEHPGIELALTTIAQLPGRRDGD
jgi:Fe-S-cluster containining protein